MDDLAAAFSGTVGVSFSLDSSSTQHPRMCMYKSRESKQSQEARRMAVLESQKEKRKDHSNIARKLAEEDWANISLSDDEKMEHSSAATKPTKKKKRERYYSNQLMLSEWLVDIPSDLAENWLMVPCPVGRRAFVLASKGMTHHYAKSGFLMNSFQSSLPGGSRNQSRRDLNYTILDCIYSEVHRTFWVLDIMCWHGHPVYDSDTEFRFFWLQSKLSENPHLAKGTKRNPIKFRPLPNYGCDKKALQDALAITMPFPDKLDGVLFYHKALHYVPGVTPLVGWLRPWMLPEVLSVPIPASLMAQKPSGAQLRPPSSSSSLATKAHKAGCSKETPSVEMDISPTAQEEGRASASETNCTSSRVEASSTTSNRGSGNTLTQISKDEPAESMDAVGVGLSSSENCDKT